MIVPSYWASCSKTHRANGRSYTVRRWGWSNDSQQAAQEHANTRAAQALEQVASQWPDPHVDKFEPKRAYNGAEGVPIREEVIERMGEEVITRNSYGALCLNTPDIMFVDVDRDKIQAIPAGRLGKTCLALLLLAAASTVVFPNITSAKAWWLGFAFVLSVGPWLVNRIWRNLEISLAGGPRGVVDAQVQRLLDADPASAWALYQTPGGYRVMALHRRFDPSSQETAAIMDGFMADRLYALMCRKQHCFRARVSPKPWRMEGMDRMRSPVWPVEGEALARRRHLVCGW